MRLKHGIILLSLMICVLLNSTLSANSIHNRKYHSRQLHRYPHFRPYGRLCTVCLHPQSDIILMESNQNIGRALPDACECGWWWRCIALSGGVNFDFGKFGNRNIGNHLLFASTGQGYTGENTDLASINDAYINISATINNWVNAFIGLSYMNGSNFYSVAYQTAPDSLDFGDNNNQLNIQQAYFHIGNFAVSPFFFEFGQQFQDFGRYSLHPITESMTQSLTETLRTSAKVGFITDIGVYGSAAAFQNPVPKTIGGHLSFDYVGGLGYKIHDCDYDFDIGGSYLYDFQGVNLIGNTAAFRAGVPAQFGVYHKRVNGYAFYTDLTFYPLGVSLRYVATPQRMSPFDLPQDRANLTIGAKPWAASGQGNYGFRWRGLEQNIYLGYQVSRETVFLNLPRARYVLGYDAYICKSTTFSAEWDHDVAYPVSEGGPHQGNSNLISFRVGITFD